MSDKKFRPMCPVCRGSGDNCAIPLRPCKSCGGSGNADSTAAGLEAPDARRERLIANGYKTDSRCSWLAIGRCAECGREHDGGVPATREVVMQEVVDTKTGERLFRPSSAGSAGVQSCDHALPMWAGDTANGPQFWCKKCGAFQFNSSEDWVMPSAGSAGNSSVQQPDGSQP